MVCPERRKRNCARYTTQPVFRHSVTGDGLTHIARLLFFVEDSADGREDI